MDIQNKRINQLIDDNLIEAYQSSVKHFGSKDLVLVFDESKNNDPIDVYERNKLIENPNIPDFLKNKLSKPAQESSGKLNYSEVAFWLVVFYSDGESECTAVKRTLMAPSGNA